MKRSLMSWILTLSLVPTPLLAQEEDEKPLRALAKSFAAAWNRQDAAGIGTLFSSDAVLTGPDGTTSRGTEGIVQAFSRELQSSPRLSFSGEEFRFLGNAAAVWRCEWKLKSGERGTGLAVLQKTGSGWVIVEDLVALTPEAPSAGHSHDDEPHDHAHPEGQDHSHDHGDGHSHPH